MSKFRKFAVTALAICAAVSATAALAACEGNYPDYKNPADGIPPIIEDPSGKTLYTINVLSMGGLYLNNVQVDIEKDGQTVVSGISRSGKIEAYLTPDEYELKVNGESLPDGYYVPDDADFKTNAPDDEDPYVSTVSLPSKVIPTAASQNKLYAIGDVMHDFGYTTSDGVRHLLSEELETKKAVILNFWYTTCYWCNEEFPALQKVYESYKDVAQVIALDHQDSVTAINNYQELNGLTFHMAYDAAGITSRFSVTGYPTTVVIDRYGVVAYSASRALSESAWRTLFSTYTADNYSQDFTPPVEDPGGDNQTYEWVKPHDIEIPDASTFKGLLGDTISDKVTGFRTETNEEDAVNNWPWIFTTGDGRTYLEATNTNADPSYSIIYVDLELKKGDIVSYDYNVLNNENYEALYVIMNASDLLKEYNGTSDGWQTEEAIYTAHRDETVTISFTFYKLYDSQKITSAENFARIANIRVENVEDITDPIDFALSVHEEGITADNLYLDEDGLYRITGTGNENYDGNLLLIDLWGATTWSENHTGSTTFIPEEGSNNSYYSSMYYLSFWYYSNRGGSETLSYNYLTRSETDFLNEMLNLQNFSESGYLPVTERLRTILEKFCATFKDDKKYTGTYYETEWIEMCYIYRHYNGAHGGDRICYAKDDPVKGMSQFNALEAFESTAGETVLNHVNIKSIYSHNGGGGIYYTFTPSKPGVYRFYSISRQSASVEISVDGSSIGHDLTYDFFTKSGVLNNFYGYHYFSTTDTVYLQAHFRMGSNATGEFDFVIEYVDESFDWLRMATTGDGMFVGTDENFSNTVYIAIPWAYNPDEGCYYSYFNHEFGSKIYIDFVHPNYYEQNNRTLKEMIDLGYFNLSGSPYFYNDFTVEMRNYYEKSIEGKDPDDELYGMVEADEDLVNMIATVFNLRNGNGDGLESSYWLSVACYYHHYGPVAED